MAKAIDIGWLIGVAIVTALVLLAVVMLVLGPLAGSGMETERLAAVLTFFGVLVTGVVTVMGLLLKSLAERRLEKEKEYDRDRLRLEAAMRAGSLLATSEGVPATPATMAAGLLALTQLGQCELAVALLVDLWSEEKADHGCGHQHGTTKASPAKLLY